MSNFSNPLAPRPTILIQSMHFDVYPFLVNRAYCNCNTLNHGFESFPDGSGLYELELMVAWVTLWWSTYWTSSVCSLGIEYDMMMSVVDYRAGFQLADSLCIDVARARGGDSEVLSIISSLKNGFTLLAVRGHGVLKSLFYIAGSMD